MARRKKQKNIRLHRVLWGLAFLVLYLGWRAWDQHRLITNLEESIAEQKATNAAIEEEIKSLENAMEHKDDLNFIMDLAKQYGMVPTEDTPTPIVFPEMSDENPAVNSGEEEAVTETHFEETE